MTDRDELLRLLRRDHRELEMALIELVGPDLALEQRRQILDGARLGLEAHGAAEEIVVYPAIERVAMRAGLANQIETAYAAHAELETLLGHVLETPLGSPAFVEQVYVLRVRAVSHAAREENVLIPKLRDSLPDAEYRALAGAFATERLRQLSLLQPSAPVAMPPELVRH